MSEPSNQKKNISSKPFILCFCIPFFNSSCNNSNNNLPDLTQEITGTYTGSIHVVSPPLQNTSYAVTVTQVSNNRVRITPSTKQAESDIMKPNSTTLACVSCGTNQLTFTFSASSVMLNYNYNTGEQFSGTKPEGFLRSQYV